MCRTSSDASSTEVDASQAPVGHDQEIESRPRCRKKGESEYLLVEKIVQYWTPERTLQD